MDDTIWITIPWAVVVVLVLLAVAITVFLVALLFWSRGRRRERAGEAESIEAASAELECHIEPEIIESQFEGCCPRCETKVQPEARFCMNCGAAV
ncbi:MAG: zinc ribbon domain-containing protein [Oscillospiraceae bacterium]|nr:zinc ribbon domain-containing protein [Oscillospiraceae bacterium]